MKKFCDWLSEQQEEHPMIDVDGVSRHRLNSNGQPIHPTDEGIKNFHRWFGDSKVVDEHGRPRVVYHGTAHDFESFDTKATPVNDTGYMGRGSYFHTNPKHASQYSYMASDAKHGDQKEEEASDANVIPVYISVRNPVPAGSSDTHDMEDHEIEKWTKRKIKSGHDGTTNGIDEWCVFHPHQIKSATGNNGDFAHPTKITESV